MSEVNGIVQIGIVVRSADEAIRNYARLIGVTKWNINYVDTDNRKGRNFRIDGNDVNVKAKIAWTNIDNIELELIEPQDDTSLFAEYLRSHGPGVHHLMFGTNDSDRTAERLSGCGIERILSGELQETRFQLFDTGDMLGTISEFAEGGALLPEETQTFSDT